MSSGRKPVPLIAQEDSLWVFAFAYILNFCYSSTLFISSYPSYSLPALYDYTGEDDTELTFAAGDRLVVVEKHDDGWCTAELSGVQGLAPVTVWGKGRMDFICLFSPFLTVLVPRIRLSFVFFLFYVYLLYGS